MHMLKAFRVHFLPHHVKNVELAVSLVLAVLVMSIVPASAVTRFQDRGLFIDNPNPGVTTNYTIDFYFYTQAPVGSINLLACVNPIPYMPCDPPAGLDMSHAVLSDQAGETGFSIDPATHTSNHMLLTRDPATTVGTEEVHYTFTGIVNPTFMDHSFAIRMADYSSSDGTGQLIDQGAVLTQIQEGVTLVTQVPPTLSFCVGRMVTANCDSVSGGWYTDMGILASDDTLTAQSQFAVATNASSGFVVTIHSVGMAAGTHVINPLALPTSSQKGVNQFGINLAANTLPLVGADPDGDTQFPAVAAAQYSQSNHFTFRDGDIIASSPGVVNYKRYTVSYIVNAAANLAPGVYSTTVGYIATGRF